MSQTTQRVLTTLRGMIVRGELEPGERLAEISMSEQLGVSRMPIRMALPMLEQEGLLEKAGKRGYKVREIGADEITGAIEVRGCLEGLAARLIAEQGLDEVSRSALADCLAEGDEIFANGRLDDGDVARYHEMNKKFHQIIVDGCGNAAVRVALACNDNLPFASANSIAVDRDHLPQEFQRLHLAHMQHHIIFEALDAGQGSRADAAMREHANAAMKYVDLFSGIKTAPANFRVIVGGAE